MLEAFEASAREARQRERSEQRRHSADRRGVVGSLLSPFRGGEDPTPDADGAPTGAAVGPESPSLGVGAVPIDRRPAGGSSWEPPLVLPGGDTSQQAVDDAGEEHSPGPEAENTASPEAESTASPEVEIEVHDEVDEPAPEDPPAPAGADAFSVPMSRWSFAAVASLALVAVFAIGMGLGGVLDEASDGEEESAALAVNLAMRPPAATTEAGSRSPEATLSGMSSQVEQAAPAADEGDYSPAELKFFEESTTVTVMAIAFDKSPENVDPAFDAYELLTAAGLPALRPYPRGNRIFVFVGGAESEGDLDDDLRKVKAVSDPLVDWADFRNARVVNTKVYR